MEPATSAMLDSYKQKYLALERFDVARNVGAHM